MKLKKMTDEALNNSTMRYWKRLQRCVTNLEAIRRERARREKLEEALPGLLPSTERTLRKLDAKIATDLSARKCARGGCLRRAAENDTLCPEDREKVRIDVKKLQAAQKRKEAAQK